MSLVASTLSVPFAQAMARPGFGSTQSTGYTASIAEWQKGRFVPDWLRKPLPYQLLADTLAGIRAMLPPGLVRSERMPADPPEVVEIWFAG
jgi:hypothetical protein